MKIVYDKKYRALYSSDPAAMPRRMETIYAVLEGGYNLGFWVRT